MIDRVADSPAPILARTRGNAYMPRRGGESAASYETGKIQVHTGVVGEIMSIVVNQEGEIFLADFKNNVVHKVSAPATP